MATPLFSTAQLIPDALSAMFADAMATRTVTLQDRYGMMAALLSVELATEERLALDRILYAIRRGTLRVA